MTVKPREFIIVTGMSGAGKTLVIRCFEDFGFFCVDNLPPTLIPTFADLCRRSDNVDRVALVVDVRGGGFFRDLSTALDDLRARGIGYRILFLDADNEALVHRFKETRRRHPLADSGDDLLDCIRREREMLIEVRERADKVLDTSEDTPRDLRDEIAETFLSGNEIGEIAIKIVSFGFKFGVPMDADLVFDVRFLKNPNYDAELGQLNGTHEAVARFVLEDSVTQEYLARLYDLLDFSIPEFVREGKTYLSVAVGCTGGRHRSVVVANDVATHLRGRGYSPSLHHRDVSKVGARLQEQV